MTVVGLLLGWENYQLMVSRHYPGSFFTIEAANQLIDCYVWSFIALVIWQLMRVFSLQGPKWKRNLVAHVVIAFAMAPLGTLLYIAGVWLTGIAGKTMSLRERLMFNLRSEIIANAIEYLTFLAIIVAVDYYRRYRDEEQENLRLQSALAESKLQTLRAQLNPHFLFNAMNSISCLLHRDPGAADTMLSRVANLLRLTLARDNSREVRLLEEVELAEEYLEIQRIRFGSRLILEINIADETLEALVPNMLLQPLVENACIHGVARRRGECRVAVTSGIEGEDLVIAIYNDGPAVRRDWKLQSGIGLRNTRERLELLYGEKATMELSNVQQGVQVLVRMPLNRSSETVSYTAQPSLSRVQPNVM